MADERTEMAVEAAAKALHQRAKDPHHWVWENAPEEWKGNLRDFVRPLVEAALEASDEFLAVALRKSKVPTDNR